MHSRALYVTLLLLAVLAAFAIGLRACSSRDSHPGPSVERIDGPRSDSARVASAERRASEPVERNEVREQARRPAPTTIAMELRVEGRIIDARTSAPIEGATVAWMGARSFSRADGRFTLKVARSSDDVRLQVDAAGYVPTEYRIADRTGIEIALQPATKFSLRVVDSVTGAPLTGATVRDDWEQILAASGADGRLAVRLERDRDSAVSIECNNYAPMQWDVEANTVAGEQPIDVPLRRLAWIEGRVLDADGDPAERASVSFTENEVVPYVRAGVPRSPGLENATYVRSARPAAECSSDGWYRLAVGPADGPLELRCRARRSVTQWRTLPPPAAGEVVRLDWRFPTPGRLRGRVTCNGRNWVHARMRFVTPGGHARTTRTSRDGIYRFSALPAGPGVLEVLASTSGPAEPPAPVGVHIVAGEELTQDVAVEEQRATIRGRVLDPRGDPMNRVLVRARTEWRSPDHFPSMKLTDSEGTFELQVPRGATYAVDAGRNVERVARPGVTPGEEGVELVVPDKIKLPLRLLSAATGATLEGSDLPRATVEVAAPSDPVFHSLPLPRMRDGVIDVPVVRSPEGTAEIRISSSRGGLWWSGVVDVPPFGEEPTIVDVPMRGGCRATIVLMGDLRGTRRLAGSQLLFLLAPDEREFVRGARPGDDPEYVIDWGGERVWMRSTRLRDRIHHFDAGCEVDVHNVPPGRYSLVSGTGGVEFSPPSFEIADGARIELTTRGQLGR